MLKNNLKCIQSSINEKVFIFGLYVNLYNQTMKSVVSEMEPYIKMDQLQKYHQETSEKVVKEVGILMEKMANDLRIWF